MMNIGYGDHSQSLSFFDPDDLIVDHPENTSRQQAAYDVGFSFAGHNSNSSHSNENNHVNKVGCFLRGDFR